MHFPLYQREATEAKTEWPGSIFAVYCYLLKKLLELMAWNAEWVEVKIKFLFTLTRAHTGHNLLYRTHWALENLRIELQPKMQISYLLLNNISYVILMAHFFGATYWTLCSSWCFCCACPEVEVEEIVFFKGNPTSVHLENSGTSLSRSFYPLFEKERL